MNEERTSKENQAENEHRIHRSDMWMKFAKGELPVKGPFYDIFNAAQKLMFYWVAFEALINEEGEQDIHINRFVSRVKDYASSKHKNKLRRIFADKEHCEQMRKLIRLPVTLKAFWIEPDKEAQRNWGAYYQQKKDEHLEAVQLIVDSTEFSEEDTREDTHNKNRSLQNALNSVLDRIYCVRNSIFHGGQSLIREGWNEKSQGATQVECAAELSGKFIPVFFEIVDENKTKDWGMPAYPRIGERDDANILPPWHHKSKR